MPISNPSQLHKFLNSLEARPRKSLSQNFLIDNNILQKMLKEANLSPRELILEIGPGPGALTEALLNKQTRILAIEKDRTFAQALSRLQTEENRLYIHNEDILSSPLEQLLKKHLSKGEKAKVVANIPYQLTTPLLTQLLAIGKYFSFLLIMVQKEVALRMTALPKSKDYSSLTIFLNFYSHIRYAFNVSKHCYYPKPNVDSAVVAITPRTPPKVSSIEAFFKMTKTAFKQRRKMLRSSLKVFYSPTTISKALTDIGQNPLARPEELSLEQFITLFEICDQTTN